MNLRSLEGPEEPSYHTDHTGKPLKMPTKAMLTYLITRMLARIGRMKG